MRRFLSASSLALTFIPIAMLAFTIALVSTSSSVVAQEAVIVLEIPPLPGDEPDEPTAEPTSTTGEVFSDRAEFEAEVCGVLVQESFPAIEDGQNLLVSPDPENALSGFPSPQTLSASTISSTLTDPLAGVNEFFVALTASLTNSNIEDVPDIFADSEGLGIIVNVAQGVKAPFVGVDDSEMESPLTPNEDGVIELVIPPVPDPDAEVVETSPITLLSVRGSEFFGGGLGDLSFSPSTPDGSFFEGFCFDYSGEGVITIFDGDEVVDTINPVAVNGPTGTFATVCWLNTEQLNVTRIEVTSGNFFDFCRVDFAFKENEVSCRSLLQDVIEDVAMIAPGEGEYDEYLLNCAIAFLGCADHDSIWIDDDQVVDCDIFYFLFKATKCLGYVSESSEVDQALADIQEVLSCITDNEIAAAEAADGSSGLIGSAAYLQSSADDFQSIGFFRKATVLRKLAWLKAAYAY